MTPRESLNHLDEVLATLKTDEEYNDYFDGLMPYLPEARRETLFISFKLHLAQHSPIAAKLNPEALTQYAEKVYYRLTDDIKAANAIRAEFIRAFLRRGRELISNQTSIHLN